MKHNYQERRERRIQWMAEASEGLCEFHGPVLTKKRLEEMGEDRLRTCTAPANNGKDISNGTSLPWGHG